MATEIKSARDALESISAWAEANLRDYGADWKLHNRLCDMLKAALALPRRNCEVGTPEEQAERFHKFCMDNSSEIQGMCRSSCPCIDSGDKCHCLCKWEQMPYEEKEGDAK